MGARSWLRVESRVCAMAAQKGHLHVVKWARENGCDWDENTSRLAAQHSFAILQWVRTNGEVPIH